MEVSTIYNPHEQTEKELLDGFVIRQKEFESIFNEVRKNKMLTPPQHFIIYGIRGSGKTSLLLKVFYEIIRRKKLKQWLIPVVFKEEQYNIRTLYKLWEGIAEHLSDDYEEFTELSIKMESYEGHKDYEEKCFELLQTSLTNKNKKIILLYDNFGVFLNKLTKKEHQRLREILITSSEIRIIGASTFVDETTYDYGKPFFDFFKPIYLKGLNKNDTIKLLIKLDEKYKNGNIKDIIENNLGRIEALRRLTGGIPRTLVLLYQIFAEDGNGDSFKDLEAVLDKVTPLYKARMDDLPPQQQEIADIIAKNWDAISVKGIAKKANMPSNAVSSQLKQLEKNRMIIKKKTSTKNNLYQLDERFFNIWYLMRYSRKKDKQKVRWLVQFLEIWCGKKELSARAQKHIECLKEGQVYDKYAYHLSEAYAQVLSSPKIQHEIIVKTRSYLKSVNSEYFNEMTMSDIELNEEASKCINSSNPESALVTLLKIKSKNSSHLYKIGYIYHFYLKDFVKAEESYLMAIDKRNSNAILVLGFLYQTEHGNLIKAEEFYRMTFDNGNSDGMWFLGFLYQNELKNIIEAEKYYRIAIEAGNSNAMNSLAWLYFKLKKNKTKALKYAKESFEEKQNIYNSHTYSVILLWHNEIEKAIAISKIFLENEKSYEEFSPDIELFLLLSIAKKQYNFVLNLFKNNRFNILDKYKPIYYALMSLMKDEFPDEILKMGSELEETVKEILVQINKLKQAYS